MIAAADILRLAFTADLAQAGISYACQSLLNLYNRAGHAGSNHLRDTVAEAAVELAVRRHLVSEGVPFEVRAAVPFTAPNHFDIVLRGRRCNIRTSRIARPKEILSILADPGQLLGASALVPVDEYAADGQSGQDLYFFAFVPDATVQAPGDGPRPDEPGSPPHLVHVMPGAWAHPRVWMPLGPLVLKSEDRETRELEVGGQDRDRANLVCSVVLSPRTRLELAGDFHSLTYIGAGTRPTGRIGIRSPTRRETQIIRPTEWENIWITGTEIYVVGWMTREYFRQRATVIPGGTRVVPYGRTRTKNLSVPISELKPLARLFDRARC